ncbi:D-alanyl-D-alanine carboxypeptidase [Microbacterium sp. bgisy203]|uniref:D-alanyl-D-alanine carboxypeptidase n=1 Tax=Microbacterium sp. bgisy203 TaxID=3413799 RepID=UPI003D725AD1
MEDARPSSRRARREAAHAGGADIVTGDDATTSSDAQDAAGDGSDLAAPGLADDDAAASAHAGVALAWLSDDEVTPRYAPADLTASTHPYAVAAPDLLARRPRRSPVRAGTVAPVLAALGLAGAYAASTLLWPLYAVTPTVTETAIADIAAPASAVAWPAEGSAAVGIAGFDSVAASTADPSSMASITKIVTSLMILEQMPLAPGESGPEFAFTARDRQTYYAYLADDESALNVPVGGSLTQYQMLQGILIGSAGNYTDRLASTIWPTDAVFARAARTWLDQHNLPGITIVDPTGIDRGNTADPSSLITLARLALADPVIAEIVRTPSVTLPGAGEVTNTNDLLSDPAVVGIKTGSLRGTFNLLAAKEQAAGDTTLRAYAVALGQSTDEARDGETARLLTDVLAEASQPRVLPAGTPAGTVSTAWGVTVQMATDADVSLLLWNGASAAVTSDLSLGDARAANDAVGTVATKGPLGSATTGVHLTADIPGPDAWWRLTHPLQLWGLAD